MHRPSAAAFLMTVLEDLEGLPDGLARRLSELVEGEPEERPQAIRALLEEISGE